jgi:hypothetical protein
MPSKAKRNFIDNNSGVSPVVGMILILGIVIVSIGIIYTSGIPMIDNAKLNTHIQIAQNSFSVLHNDIEEVARSQITGVGTVRTTSISMDGGSLAVIPDCTRINVSYNGGNTPYSWVPGTISYEYRGRSVIYENGAVFTKYPSFSVMEMEPLIYAVNMSGNKVGIMIHIINISSIDSSIGGKGTGKIKTSMADDGFNNIFTGDVTIVAINITSQNYEAWGRYFNNTLSHTGATYSSTQSNDTVNILINSSSSGIKLSIHETDIKSIVG